MSIAISNTRASIKALGGHLIFEYLNFYSESNKILYTRIREHRNKYYHAKAPHLLEPFEIKTEEAIDQRSTLFCVSYNGQILTSLRLTPPPFEVESYEMADVDFSKFNGFFEISRLVTAPDLERMKAALAVKYLLCWTGLHAIEKDNAQGLVAMCRPYRVSLFSKFGMQKIGEVFSFERKIYYSLLAANIEQILEQTGLVQSNDSAMQERLIKIFGKESSV